ncbi:MAG: hypothetical protein JJT78_10055 [Leptospira sp.]|nr:hypothetical protein [Leptospira sp.]
MLGFVGTPRRLPDDSGSNDNPDTPPLWTLLFMGCLLINTVTFSFIPMSQISGYDVSLLFLVLVVLPLLFLSLFLASKFGYGILFAAFLSIPGGITSVIVLGDYFAIAFNKNIITSIQVREATNYPTAKVFEFNNPKLLIEKKFDTVQNRSFRERPGGSEHLPPFYHSLVPIVDTDFPEEGEDISAFAVCTHSKDRPDNCNFSNRLIFGGFQVPESLRLVLKNASLENAKGLNFEIKNSPVFLYWVEKPRDRVVRAGLYGLGFVLFLNLFWVISVYFYYFMQKK